MASTPDQEIYQGDEMKTITLSPLLVESIPVLPPETPYLASPYMVWRSQFADGSWYITSRQHGGSSWVTMGLQIGGTPDMDATGGMDYDDPDDIMDGVDCQADKYADRMDALKDMENPTEWGKHKGKTGDGLRRPD
jgi:hypothetical protein